MWQEPALVALKRLGKKYQFQAEKTKEFVISCWCHTMRSTTKRLIRLLNQKDSQMRVRLFNSICIDCILNWIPARQEWQRMQVRVLRHSAKHVVRCLRETLCLAKVWPLCEEKTHEEDYTMKYGLAHVHTPAKMRFFHIVWTFHFDPCPPQCRANWSASWKIAKLKTEQQINHVTTQVDRKPTTQFWQYRRGFRFWSLLLKRNFRKISLRF